MGENQEIGSKLLGISRRWRLHPTFRHSAPIGTNPFKRRKHTKFLILHRGEEDFFIFTSMVIILTSEYSFLTFNKHFAEQYERRLL